MKQPKKPKSSKKEKPARLERRVRVTFFIVAGTKEEIAAVEDVYGYLGSQYLSDEDKRELPVTGFTYSAIPKPVPLPWPPILGESVFIGHWWYTTKEGRKIPMKERSVLFFIDLLALAEEWKIDQSIGRLKTEIFRAYARRGSPQEEIWIVKQDIYRYA